MGKKQRKFKRGFAAAAREELEREAEQKRLHEKHGDIDEDTVIVEKDNTVKFLIRMAARGIRICAAAAVLIFATLGIIALVYPEVRVELFKVLQTVFGEVKGMVGI